MWRATRVVQSSDPDRKASVGLVFVGDFNRWIRAFDVLGGDVLWGTRLNGPVMGFPISYEVDGVQYVAVATGWGGGSIWRVPAFLTPDLNTPLQVEVTYLYLG